jgi:hypothetical protein
MMLSCNLPALTIQKHFLNGHDAVRGQKMNHQRAHEGEELFVDGFANPANNHNSIPQM